MTDQDQSAWFAVERSDSDVHVWLLSILNPNFTEDMILNSNDPGHVVLNPKIDIVWKLH